ncbi:MAG TPA: ABC transporter ATP-binding protein [Gaiellaceae bacterium]|nr:ABC transporter ATP-binding protein [Gaiellaceae bacterium]
MTGLDETALSARGLGKRFGSTWGLRDCTLDIPVGSVTALVGPNGAGKTTLLQLAVGLLRPTTGELRVLGLAPRDDVGALLPRVAFVAQDHPLHRRFTVRDTLTLGRRLNPSWDDEVARRRIEGLDLPLDRKVGKLSGGQQAQVALTLALAKRPELLILDEPVASLDPLARREFLSAVLEVVSDAEISVILSSHILADLERVCDHVVILSHAQTLLVGAIDDVLAEHRLLTGPRADAAAVARGHDVIRERHTERQTSLLVRSSARIYDSRWEVHEVDLEEIVLAYLGYGEAHPEPVRELDEAVAR